MSEEQVLKVVRREMKAYAMGWRMDWSDFDGRSLRDQMNWLDDWATKALSGETSEEFTEGSEFEKERGA